MKTIVICEDNVIVSEDLSEIVKGFDPVLNVAIVPSIASLKASGIRADSISTLILSGNRGNLVHRDFLERVQSFGGCIICMETLGPGQDRPDDWIKIETPFTTKSVERALALALKCESG